MAEKVIKWVTEDGREFLNQIAAERHEKRRDVLGWLAVEFERVRGDAADKDEDADGDAACAEWLLDHFEAVAKKLGKVGAKGLSDEERAEALCTLDRLSEEEDKKSVTMMFGGKALAKGDYVLVKTPNRKPWEGRVEAVGVGSKGELVRVRHNKGQRVEDVHPSWLRRLKGK